MDLVQAHIEHMQRRGLSPDTVAIRQRRLRAFDAHAGLADADWDDIDAFLDSRSGRDGGPITPKTRYDWISHLHTFYSWAVDYGHLDSNPTRRVTRPRLKNNLPRPIATSDLVMALDLATPTMRAWLSLMAFDGLRCVEVSRLDVESLLWDDGLLRVLGKGDKERLVPMHAEVRRTLESVTRPKRGRVFRRPHGGGYPASQVSRDTNTYLDSLGIAATAHQLCHWFGTNLYRACHDLRVVQELMGHASPSTTAIYVAWSREEAYTAIGKLGLDVPSSLFAEWAA